ncbi:MAG: hypothetical protein M3N21_01555 [Actinomycetota bacterium]|nr:hypothetical protein [Actinomycetota bacterium]
MTTGRLSATCSLLPGTGLDTVAEWLVRSAAAWDLPAVHPRRWVVALEREIPRTDEVELYLEYDPVTQLATVELWHTGKVVFGIDDWLGTW